MTRNLVTLKTPAHQPGGMTSQRDTLAPRSTRGFSVTTGRTRTTQAPTDQPPFGRPPTARVPTIPRFSACHR
ncbi:hypothetical protein [Haladaptatus pallidirubidus]|uniref:hypothetical protein n=1 Tax=Haladaptatus pallidirubidus TaxID=1008152 RepID=UPI001D11D8C9|nr:hypothetical protein [Haladaptatus pallidirubidus]